MGWPPFYLGDFVPQVVAGTKTMTRRNWRKKCFVDGFLNNVGRKWHRAQAEKKKSTQVGWVRVSDMYKQSLRDMPEEDLVPEGCGHLNMAQFVQLPCFKDVTLDTKLWVVVFEFRETLEFHGG